MAGVVFCRAVCFASNILCVILKLLLKMAVTITAAITVGKAAAILHDMNRRISNGKKKSCGR